MRYLITTFRIFVIVAVVLAIANFSDVKKTRAVGTCPTITTSGPIDPACENMNVTISGNITVTIDGEHTYGDFTIQNGTTVTHTAGKTTNGQPDGPAVGMKLNVNNLTIDATSKINANGNGYPSNTGYVGRSTVNNGQNGANGGNNPTLGDIVSGIVGGASGGKGGEDARVHYGTGGGGGYIGGGGSGIGKRTGGGGAGASSSGGCSNNSIGNGGCGHWGDRNPDSDPQDVRGGTATQAILNQLMSAIPDNVLLATNFGYGGGGSSGRCSVVQGFAYDVQTTLGGKGGGFISIDANNNIDASGAITANGQDAPTIVSLGQTFGCGGAGAGGSVFLKAANEININGNGNISVHGGNGAWGAYTASESGFFNPSGGGAGGGGIIVALSPNSSSIPNSKFSVIGGAINSVVATAWPTFRPYGLGGDGLVYKRNLAVVLPSGSIQSKKVEVTVKWKEGNVDKQVKLYSVLRSVVTTP